MRSPLRALNKKTTGGFWRVGRVGREGCREGWGNPNSLIESEFGGNLSNNWFMSIQFLYFWEDVRMSLEKNPARKGLDFRLFVHGWTPDMSGWRKSLAFRIMLKEMAVVMYCLLTFVNYFFLKHAVQVWASIYTYIYICIHYYCFKTLAHNTRSVDVDLHISWERAWRHTF